MRLAITLCGLALVAGQAFAQSELMPAPSPEPMMMEIAARNGATPIRTSKATQATNKEADKKLDRQVSATQLKIQQEERKLQAQFAQLDQMRNAAIDKQNQAELERIQQLEKQIVAAYQKRVEQILVGAQAQIQATTIHVQPNQAQQPTPAPQPTKARTQTRTTQTGQARTQSRGNTPAQKQQQTRQSNQSRQQSSSYRSWWRRR